ncbi:MAG TPA: hypothetical protein V6C58_05950 [Allocoleopsis sp.]
MKKHCSPLLLASLILSSSLITLFTGVEPSISKEVCKKVPGLGTRCIWVPGPNKGTNSSTGCTHCNQPKQKSINIVNATALTIYYQLDGQNFTLAPNYARMHYTTNNYANISFDSSYDPGDQRANYTLGANSNYKFQSSGGNSFNIYRY